MKSFFYGSGELVAPISKVINIVFALLLYPLF